MDGSGDFLHVVYDIDYDNGSSLVGYKKSYNGGEDWYFRFLSDDGSFPRLATSGKYVHVIYSYRDGSNISMGYRSSNDNGTTWGTAARLTSALESLNSHAIASQEGYVYVIFVDKEGALNLVRSEDNGKSWASPKVVARDPGIVVYPEISVSEGVVHITYYGSNKAAIYYLRNTDHAKDGHWGVPARVLSGNQRPSISSEFNDVVIVCVDGTDVIAKVSTDAGGNWSDVITIATSGVEDCSVVWDNNGRIHVAWHGRDPGDGKGRLNYSRSDDDGATFSNGTDVVVAPTGSRCSDPSMVVTKSRVHLTWTDDREDGTNAGGGATYGTEIFYKRNRDIVPPGLPVVTSPTHPEGEWTSDSDPVFEWNVKPDDSGIEGYSIELDSSSDTVPAPRINHTANWTQEKRPDGIWFFHVRAKDRSGNWGDTSHYGIKIDTKVGTPIIWSPTHPESEYRSDANPIFRWYIEGENRSGIDYYSFNMSRNPADLPDDIKNASTNITQYENLEDGIWYFYAKAHDKAGNWGGVGHYVVYIDMTGPEAPEVISTSHPNGTWVASRSPSFKWNEPWDRTRISGYSCILTRLAGTIPVEDVSETDRKSTQMADGDDIWYFHLRAVDELGNWGETSHCTVMIDTTPPTSPVITSPTHQDGDRWYSNDEPSFEWTTSNDSLSGFLEYRWALTAYPGLEFVPSNVTGSTTWDEHPVDDGLWFFHVVAIDTAGNWVDSFYLIRVDTTPPRAPTITSPTYQEGTWTSDKRIEVEWGGLLDDGINDSGILAYHLVLGRDKSVTPLVQMTALNHSLTIDQGGTWYFKVQAEDGANNLGDIGLFIVLFNPAPRAMNISASSTHILRDHVVILYANGTDDDLFSLMCYIGYRPPYGGNWTELRANHVDDHWELAFKPALDAELGNYSLRVRFVDKYGQGTEPMLAPNPIEVMNNRPQVTGVSLSRYKVQTGKEVRIYITGTDKEDGKQGLICRLRYSFDNESWSDIETTFDGSRWTGVLDPSMNRREGKITFQAMLVDGDLDGSGWVPAGARLSVRAPPGPNYFFWVYIIALMISGLALVAYYRWLISDREKRNWSIPFVGFPLACVLSFTGVMLIIDFFGFEAIGILSFIGMVSGIMYRLFTSGSLKRTEDQDPERSEKSPAHGTGTADLSMKGEGMDDSGSIRSKVSAGIQASPPEHQRDATSQTVVSIGDNPSDGSESGSNGDGKWEPREAELTELGEVSISKESVSPRAEESEPELSE